MGHGRWSSDDYRSYAAVASEKPRNALYARTSKASPTKSGQEVNIEKVTFRESRDSEANPASTPVMIALDVTGSMGVIPEKLTKGGLGILVDQTIQRKPITDPHILFMAIGDAVEGDQAPLQVTQFEADNRICDQLTDLWLEGKGGGNSYESYDLAWAFAAYLTRTDAWEKRKEKGFLFTVGDEEFPRMTSRIYLENVFKDKCPQSPTPESLLAAAQERYHVFHVIIGEGSYASGRPEVVKKNWRQRLGNRALFLSNYHFIGELIVSAMALEKGAKLEEVLGWWEQSTSKVLYDALVPEALV